MKPLKRLALSIALLAVLFIVALAGETQGPPAPCIPGETGAPPCHSQSVTDSSIVPGETGAPPLSSLDAALVEALNLALSLF
jgi:hypothetical protein